SDDSASKEEAPAAKEEKKEAPAAKEESTDSSDDSANDDVVASPAARKLAREKNIDLSKVKAQDPLDRIRTEDVERASQAPAPSKAVGPGIEYSAPEQEITETARREKMSCRRQTIAKRLVEAQHNTAMLTNFNEVDMTADMKLRKERQESIVKKND